MSADKIKKPRRIGILGGTFNPIHIGHLVLADQACQVLRLDKAIFVPVNFPPHKRSKKLVAAKQRYRMVALAIQSNPHFSVSDIELTRAGLSYSIETLRRLKAIFPQAKLYFIVGSDFLKEFASWKDTGKLTRISQFVVAQRPHFALRRLPKNMQAIAISALDISSTSIRRRIKKRQSVRYLVPEKVRRYILRKGLYR